MQAERPRVVVLQKYLAPYRADLFDAMAAADIDLVALCYGAPERRRRYDAPVRRGFRVESALVLSLQTSYERNLEFPVGLPAALDRLAPAAVVCAPDWGGLVAARHCARTGAALVVWTEATAVTEAGVGATKRAIRARLYRRADRVVVAGEAARDYVWSLAPGVEVEEVRNCLDVSSLASSRDEIDAKFADGRARVVTFSGSLIERKGVDLLLDAHARARRRVPDAFARARLQLLGAGPLEAACVNAEGVDHRGHLSGRAYVEALRASHVFVLPSRADCNPLVVVEALATGTALVLSDGVGNFPEAVRGNGRVVARGDAAALEDALVWAFTASSSALRACALASLDLAPTFGLDCNAAAFARLLETLAHPVAARRAIES